MSEYRDEFASSSSDSPTISNNIKFASEKLTLERACRLIDRGIYEMWQNAPRSLAPDDADNAAKMNW
jgi:hypothetical protein